MPFHKISRDVKLAAIKLYERDLLPLSDILDCLGFSKRTFYRILNLWYHTGDVVPHKFGLPVGRPRLLDLDDRQYPLRLIRHHPDWFLDELLNLLATNRFISIHFTTIHRELERAGRSRKKLKKIASERNEEAQSAFIDHIAQYEPEELGFLDETSKNKKTPSRSCGRAKKVNVQLCTNALFEDAVSQQLGS